MSFEQENCLLSSATWHLVSLLDRAAAVIDNHAIMS